MPRKYFPYSNGQPLAPIALKFRDKTINTFAVIDSGSQRSLCPLKILSSLGATVGREKHEIQGICGNACRDGYDTEEKIDADVVGSPFAIRFLVPFDTELPFVFLGVNDFLQHHEVILQKNGFWVSSRE